MQGILRSGVESPTERRLSLIHIFRSRVRYSEIDEDGKLTLPAILNYFQDCCTFHSEDVGLGMKKLRKIHRGWVLSSWQIIVERYPEHGEELLSLIHILEQ